MLAQVLTKADMIGGKEVGAAASDVANDVAAEGREWQIEALLDAITEKAKQKKLLLIIDQYPNFVKADASFDETLFSYVTRKWEDLPIKVILCGDAFLLMEKYLYGKNLATAAGMWQAALRLV